MILTSQCSALEGFIESTDLIEELVDLDFTVTQPCHPGNKILFDTRIHNFDG